MQVFRTEHGTHPKKREVRAFVDGEQLDLPTPDAAAAVGPYPQLLLGPHLFAGSIAEVIVVGGRMSEAESLGVDAYLRARRTGASAELPALDGLLAHFRADEDTVERHEEEFVKSWTASNDAELILAARGGPRRTTFVAEAEGQPAYVSFNVGWGSAHWMEVPLPAATSAESITVCWLGEYADGHNYTRTAYTIESLEAWWTERDDRILKTGAGGAFSSDGRYGARVMPEPKHGGSVIVTDLRTGHTVAQFEGGDYHFSGVSFHPDGRRLACAAIDGAIEIFDIGTQQLVHRVEAHTGNCWDVAYSPDGKLLASGGNDNALRLWDAETYEPLLELPGHRSYVRSVNWSSDGSMLVSGSGDYGVRIWDATPRSERYAQLLASRALEGEVRPQVVDLHATAAGHREAVADEIRRRFASDAARRRAALKVLARLE